MVGFEPTNSGFADRSLQPLGYTTIARKADHYFPLDEEISFPAYRILTVYANWKLIA